MEYIIPHTQFLWLFLNSCMMLDSNIHTLFNREMCSSTSLKDVDMPGLVTTCVERTRFIIKENRASNEISFVGEHSRVRSPGARPQSQTTNVSNMLENEHFFLF